MTDLYTTIPGWLQAEQVNNLLADILPVIASTDSKLTNTVKFAEIGVYMGRGTALFNQYFKHYNIDYKHYAIDHFQGSEEHGKNINYWKLANSYLEPIMDNINLIKNDSVAESKNYPNHFFDIVYIDASHDYNSVKQDIATWLPLVREGGVICGDDYNPGWPGVIKAVDTVFNNSVNVADTYQWWVKVTNNYSPE